MAKYQVLRIIRPNYKQNLIVVADNHLDAAKLVIAKDKNLTIIEINTANQANLIVKGAKVTKYYSIQRVIKNPQNQKNALGIIQKWFDNQINNWYNDHIADGDEDLDDYIIMDDYESNVGIIDNNTLIFYGYCDGHYANIEPSDEVEDLIESFIIRAEELTEMLSDIGIDSNKDVSIKENDIDVVVILKKLTIEQFANKILKKRD